LAAVSQAFIKVYLFSALQFNFLSIDNRFLFIINLSFSSEFFVGLLVVFGRLLGVLLRFCAFLRIFISS